MFLESSLYYFLFSLSYVIHDHISYSVNSSCLNKRCCCCCCYITRFLDWKDRKGKTKKIYVPACSSFGTKQTSLCACSTNLAAGTVDNLMGKLRSLFTDLGRGGKVNELLDVGNPASHPSSRQYLACIREEQAQARVIPTQATPFFYEKKDGKLKRLSILAKISKHFTSNYIGKRDYNILSVGCWRSAV